MSQTETVKKGRGRPKGAKNKPKASQPETTTVAAEPTAAQ